MSARQDRLLSLLTSFGWTGTQKDSMKTLSYIDNLIDRDIKLKVREQKAFCPCYRLV